MQGVCLGNMAGGRGGGGYLGSIGVLFGPCIGDIFRNAVSLLRGAIGVSINSYISGILLPNP